MSFSPEQLAAVGAAIRANPLFWENGVPKYQSNDEVSEWFNSDSEAVCWRNNVPGVEIVSCVNAGEVQALSGGQVNVYMQYVTVGCDPTKAAVRQGLRSTVFGPESQSWSALLGVLRRPATHLEALFSSIEDGALITEIPGARLAPYDVQLAIGG